jgi:hypothetical protein
MKTLTKFVKISIFIFLFNKLNLRILIAFFFFLKKLLGFGYLLCGSRFWIWISIDSRWDCMKFFPSSLYFFFGFR